MKKNRKPEVINEFNFARTDTLPKCSPEQATKFFQEAREFIACTRFYGSMREDAACAVAEYIAYQAGYTVRDWS